MTPAFPLHLSPSGRTAPVLSHAEHVRDELLQLLLTGVGERPFIPEFGTPLRRLVFENLDEATLAVTKSAIADSVTRWLGHRMALTSLDVSVNGSMLTVDLGYRVLAENTLGDLRLERELG